MKINTLLLLGSLAAITLLSSCVDYGYGYGGGYGYGSSYSTRPVNYGGSYGVRPLVTYNSFNSYTPRSSWGYSTRPYYRAPSSISWGGFGYNRGWLGAPSRHSTHGFTSAPVSIPSHHGSSSGWRGSHSAPGNFGGGSGGWGGSFNGGSHGGSSSHGFGGGAPGGSFNGRGSHGGSHGGAAPGGSHSGPPSGGTFTTASSHHAGGHHGMR